MSNWPKDTTKGTAMTKKELAEKLADLAGKGFLSDRNSELIRNAVTEMRKQAARIAELEEVVERLPVTADGKAIIPSRLNRFWITTDKGKAVIKNAADLVETAAKGWGYWSVSIRPRTRGMMVDDEWIGVDQIYSTREAAEAARKAEQ